MNQRLDFVIAGSAKSGTTALASILDQHPGVYMSDFKETDYFVYGYGDWRELVNHDGRSILDTAGDIQTIDSEEKYRAMFSGAGPDMLLGEASPLYLLNPAVPDRIMSYAPKCRVVIILRNPADVAFANFVHHVRDYNEVLSVGDLDEFLNPARYARPELHPFARHLDLPRYSVHLPAWVDGIPEQQLHIMVYEDFRRDKPGAIRELLQFLDLDPDFEADLDGRVNISALPKSDLLNKAVIGSAGIKRMLRPLMPAKVRQRMRLKIESLNAGEKPVLPENVRSRLDELYVQDLDYVEGLLGRRMDHWRESSRTGGNVA